MPIVIRLLGPGDHGLLERVGLETFDYVIDPIRARAFVEDPRHHMVVALDDSVVVGMVSAVHYFHPDKPLELWVNEVGVALTHRRQGIATQLLAEIFAHGRTLGCTQAWVTTERDNSTAIRLYESAGGERDDCVMISWELS